MTPEEKEEYGRLLDKRIGGLSKKEHLRYLVLLDKAFSEGIPKIMDTWTKSFGIK